MGLFIDASISFFFSKSAEERQLRTKIKFKIRGSIRIRLFSGADLTHRRTTEPAAKAAATAAAAVAAAAAQTSQTKSVRFAPIETASSGRAPPSTARHANVRQNTNYCVFPFSKSIILCIM